MKRPLQLLLAAGVVLLVTLGFFLQRDDEAVAELLVRPQQGPFTVAVTTTGELQAKNSVQIYGPRNARQARIYELKLQRLVPEGTVVQKGDFVAAIDQSELASKIKDADIELQKAQSQHTQTRLDTALTLSKARDEQINLRFAMEEAQLRRDQARYEPPSVQRQAEIDFEKAERAYRQALVNYDTQQQQAKAKMSEVNAELDKALKARGEMIELASAFTIRAPENGMVIYYRNWRGEKTTSGSTVNAWDPVVATLPDLSVMESITYVNEVDIQKIAQGQPVEIGLDAAPDKRLTGTVTSVANVGEQRPNTDAKVFEVRIEIAETDTTLRPAMTTSNTILVAQEPQALHVPLEAIHSRDSLTFVFARDGSRTVRQEVRLGLINENRAVVAAGLDAATSVHLAVPADTAGLSLRRLPAPGDEATLAESDV